MTAPEIELRSILSSRKPATWVLTGDSITHGAAYTFGVRSYPEHFMERVRWELHRLTDTVINTGLSGDTTGGLLSELHGRVLRFRPDVTSIMMGMNDCVNGGAGREDYRRNLLALVDAIEARASLLLLHTPNPIRPGSDAERTDLAQYAEIVHEVAAERNILLVDHYESWTAQERKRPGALRGWLDADGIHPNAAGHREFARLFFVRLGIFAADSLTCRLCSEDPVNSGGSV